MANSGIPNTIDLCVPPPFPPGSHYRDNRPSGKTCEIQSCRKSRRTNADVKLFKFPSNHDARQTWATILNISVETLSTNPVLCQDHFNPKFHSKKRLHKNAIPMSSSEAEQLKLNQLQKYSTIQSSQSGTIDVVLIPHVPKIEPVQVGLQSIIQTNTNQTSAVDLIEIKTESQPIYIPVANEHNSCADKLNTINDTQSVTAPIKMVVSECEMSHKDGLSKDTRICIVPNCRKSERKHIDLVFFTFPADYDERQAWAKILNIPAYALSGSLYVCSDHFHPKSIGRLGLRKNAMPINIGTTKHSAAYRNATIASTNQPEAINKSNTQSANEPDETEVDLLPESQSLYTALLEIETKKSMQDMSTDNHEHQHQFGELNQVSTEPFANSDKGAGDLTDPDNEISCPKCHQLLMVETETYSKIIFTEVKHDAYEPTARKKRDTVYKLRENYRRAKIIARRKRHKIKQLRLQLKLERHRHSVLKICAQKQSNFWLEVLPTSVEKLRGRMSAVNEIRNMLTIRKPRERKSVYRNPFTAVFVINS